MSRLADGQLVAGAWLAVFPSANALDAALAMLPEPGWLVIEVYTPFDLDAADVHEPPRARSWLPLVGLIAGAFGAIGAFVIQWWTNARSYPMNVGGRPRPAIPAYIPITFESMILAAASAVVIAWIVMLGLPRLWAPIDELDGFARASLDEFWLQAVPPAGMAADVATATLRGLGALRVVQP
ncbi:MAG TPA: DUF3341 domain-containing protein [Gemmatimonadales bacterium]